MYFSAATCFSRSSSFIQTVTMNLELTIDTIRFKNNYIYYLTVNQLNWSPLPRVRHTTRHFRHVRMFSVETKKCAHVSDRAPWGKIIFTFLLSFCTCLNVRPQRRKKLISHVHGYLESRGIITVPKRRHWTNTNDAGHTVSGGALEAFGEVSCNLIFLFGKRKGMAMGMRSIRTTMPTHFGVLLYGNDAMISISRLPVLKDSLCLCTLFNLPNTRHFVT